MLLANGFITATPSEALLQVKERCHGHEVRTTPLPTVEAMTYWLSDRGDVYGCQRMKSMCLTKPIRVESRYKKGCSIRYSVGRGDQAQAFMQNVMTPPSSAVSGKPTWSLPSATATRTTSCSRTSNRSDPPSAPC